MNDSLLCQFSDAHGSFAESLFVKYHFLFQNTFCSIWSITKHKYLEKYKEAILTHLRVIALSELPIRIDMANRNLL